jgi:hypothetical protein
VCMRPKAAGFNVGSLSSSANGRMCESRPSAACSGQTWNRSKRHGPVTTLRLCASSSPPAGRSASMVAGTTAIGTYHHPRRANEAPGGRVRCTTLPPGAPRAPAGPDSPYGPRAISDRRTSRWRGFRVKFFTDPIQVAGAAHGNSPGPATRTQAGI